MAIRTLLSPIPKVVQRELERRQNALIGAQMGPITSADYTQLSTSGRTPWIRMQSNAIREGKETATTYRTLDSSFTSAGIDAYSSEHRPPPGITNLKSVIKGTLGVMREVTVSFKAFSLGQLEILQDLYMTPGIGILVQWGWSYPGQSILNLHGIESDENDRWLKDTIYKAVNPDKGGGNYDALFGLVCNFNFSFVEDSTWDCSTTIVGPGAMTVDINLKSPGNALDKQLSTFLKDEINKQLTEGSPTRQVVALQNIASTSAISMTPEEAMYAKSEEEKNKKNATSSESSGTTPKVTSSNSNVYVSWKFVEDTLNSFFKEHASLNYAGRNFIDSIIENNKKEKAVPCTLPPTNDWRPLTPTEMVVPGYPISNVPGVTLDLKSEKNIFEGTTLSGQQIDFHKSNATVGDLRGVWLNFNTVVRTAFENSETMHEALNKILNKMNDGAGGLWNLQLLFSQEDFATYRIVDSNCADGASEPNSAFAFPVNTRYSFVKSATIEMRIPNALKATVMIATNAPVGIESSVADRDKVGIFKSLTRGVTDRFASSHATSQKKKVEDQKEKEKQQRLYALKTTEKFNPALADQLRQKYANDSLEGRKAWMGQLPLMERKWFEELTGDEKSYIINKTFEALEIKNGTVNSSGLIPLELSLELDGIGGFTWGNTFTVSKTALPQKYIKNAVFQIRDISHDVSQDGWTTTIVGLMRPLYNGKEISAQSFGMDSSESVTTVGAPSKDKVPEYETNVDTMTPGRGQPIMQPS